jgi:hypothetical protein
MPVFDINEDNDDVVSNVSEVHFVEDDEDVVPSLPPPQRRPKKGKSATVKAMIALRRL